MRTVFAANNLSAVPFFKGVDFESFHARPTQPERLEFMCSFGTFGDPPNYNKYSGSMKLIAMRTMPETVSEHSRKGSTEG